MSNVIQLSEVPKIDKEINLNILYMAWIKSDSIIPSSVVERFRKDVEIIRQHNLIYNKKLN